MHSKAESTPPAGYPGAPCYELWPEEARPYPSTWNKTRGACKSPQSVWGVYFYDYCDGSWEATLLPRSPEGPPLPRSAQRAGASSANAETAVRVDTREKAAARASRVVRRKARWNETVNMWTVTFPGEGVHDYDVAYKCLAGYLHHHGGGFFRARGGYIAVFELHPSGHGWHAHVLFPGPRLQPEDVRWLQVGWTRHVRRCGLVGQWQGLVRHHVKRWSSARQAASYAAKYVSKGFVTPDGEMAIPKGRRRYLPSEGLGLPECHYALFPSLGSALARCGDPRFWARLYDARPTDRPFIWLTHDPPV